MFFWLSKVLWFIVNPFNIIMLCLVAGWLMLFRKPKTGKRLVGIGLIIIFLTGMNPLSDFMIRSLENRIPAGMLPAKIDGIIVLVGMVDMESSRGELIELTAQSNRIIQGIILSKKHPEAKLIITGGSGYLKQSENLREADYLGKLAVSLGIHKSRLILERNSKNTHEHAVAIAEMLPDKNGQWVLITSAFHMPRSLGCFRKEGLKVIPFPVDYKTKLDNTISLTSFLPTSGNIGSFNVAFHEWTGLIAYRLMGYTDSVFPKQVN
ncbi:MAG TPA: YdcF family protein [Bacteroidales bacterium]|uniref:DUF218 domain-containing protein n=1 Tax=Candidatus Schekmanbacteria bacterium RIFCSPLOWO2_12_FULL_38_15 TaxID=1817883 RepID=A0A1F7SMD0_9BACT|nr:MAG: hypothetical protein A3G31_09395 [Candidatus Schekmanbacteria bacterium RIFCSPLOWO2_12_FULL_38_15]HBH82488.1 YdcF family protein [Bacteroidales bacterium]HIH13190.1 YdcF family protein [Candidatus Woesearchaeota archaeon]